jgi:hypothetical protein
MKQELAKLSKNNISLVEYSEATHGYDDRMFIQCGVVGFFVNRSEVKDLFDVLNYYLNIENFKDCYITIGKEVVSALPLDPEGDSNNE